MSKIFNFYSTDENGIGLDKCWYDSSNVKYSECVDEEGEPKVLRIVFSNGTQYQYDGVDVNQYLLFREDASQGKALNKYIKANGYKYTKLEDANLEVIEDELFFRSKNGYYVENTEDSFAIKDSQNNEKYRLDKPLDDNTFNIVCDILKALDLNFKEKNGNERKN